MEKEQITQKVLEMQKKQIMQKIKKVLDSEEIWQNYLI